jgi:TrmH family RNA methyltransferase
MSTNHETPSLSEAGRFPPPSCAGDIHVVLVETEENLNIGSVCRAMKNLGFRHLHLVAPRRFDRKRASITACHGADLLDSLSIHDTLEAALAPMQQVVGLSTRAGKNRMAPHLLHEWAPGWYRSARGPTALMFGPEDTGLTQEHIEHCTWTVRIPASAEYTSFNLAQAVLLTLFELVRQEWWTGAEPPAEERSGERPTWNEFYHLDRLVELTLTQAGFYRKGSPEPVPGLVRNLFRRMLPNKREMGILLAIFSRLERTFRYLPTEQRLSLEAEAARATLTDSEAACRTEGSNEPEQQQLRATEQTDR